MTAFNVVRFRVKSGREKEFTDAHRAMDRKTLPGFRKGALVETGERTYCFIGEWSDFQAIVNARPVMIGFLDTFRDTLEDLGGDLGATDPVSGEAVIEM